MRRATEKIACLGDLALTAPGSARVLRWFEADKGHQLPGIVEACDVTEFRHE
jgi:hypothetical protein